MFAELLGFGDFYFELGVQILEACWASRPLNGGLMELGALRWGPGQVGRRAEAGAGAGRRRQMLSFLPHPASPQPDRGAPGPP
jgi:hypothetical protein